MKTSSIEAPVLPRWAFALLLLSALACGLGSSVPVSERSFDEVCLLVRGKSAAEAEALLGPPDTRQVVFGGDERWIWWNYTFLEGPAHPPEVRGKVVHFEIVFLRPDVNERATDYSSWLVDEVLGPAYRLPGTSGKE